MTLKIRGADAQTDELTDRGEKGGEEQANKELMLPVSWWKNISLYRGKNDSDIYDVIKANFESVFFNYNFFNFVNWGLVMLFLPKSDSVDTSS